MDMTIDLEKS